MPEITRNYYGLDKSNIIFYSQGVLENAEILTDIEKALLSSKLSYTTYVSNKSDANLEKISQEIDEEHNLVKLVINQIETSFIYNTQIKFSYILLN